MSLIVIIIIWDDYIFLFLLCTGDLRRGLLCDVLYEHEDAVSTVCTSSAGRYTFTGSVDKTIKVWDNIAREIVTTFYGHTDTVNPPYHFIISFLVSLS